MYSTRVWHNCSQTTDAPGVIISVDVRVYHKSVAYFNYVLLIVVVVHRGSEIVVIVAGTHGRMTVVIIELHGYISTVRRVMVKCSALTFGNGWGGLPWRLYRSARGPFPFPRRGDRGRSSVRERLRSVTSNDTICP